MARVTRYGNKEIYVTADEGRDEIATIIRLAERQKDSITKGTDTGRITRTSCMHTQDGSHSAPDNRGAGRCGVCNISDSKVLGFSINP